MKAILVIDVQMTEDKKHICDSCPVWDEKRWICKYDFMFGHKGCPLKPIPSFKAVDLNDTRDVVMFCHGWNTCLEELEIG